MAEILVLSDETDGPVSAVVDEVRRRGIDLAICGTKTLTQCNRSLSIELDALGNASCALRDNNGVPISLCDVKSVWHRRPHQPRSHHPDTQVRHFIETEHALAVLGLADALEVTWINHPRTEQWIERNKIAQLRLARSVDLRIPPTLYSSDPEDIQRFAQRYATVAVKSAAGWVRECAKGFEAAYTQRMTADELVSEAARLRVAPVLVQPYIEKHHELRVTMVGDRAFTCRIDSQASSRTAIDWRHYDFDNVAHVGTSLPRETLVSLQRFMRVANLRFAGIDLIVDMDGRYVFLEVNPSGQYLWLEALTGAPITAALADLLQNASESDARL
ncbi:hypothetical protein [Streptomyces sp. NPDC005485]|uniref:hypothetical protein n=1 Tax=Streptomyces sp. NPDC005485 TaxID=3155591 RepID=UPI0033BE68F3